MLGISLILAGAVVVLEFLIYKLSGGIIWAVFYILYATPVIHYLTEIILGLIFFPSTLLHEVCHLIMLKLAGFEGQTLNLLPKIATERNAQGHLVGNLVMGSTTPGQSGDAQFLGLVYVAPLLLGTIVFVLIFPAGFGIPWKALLRPYDELWATFKDIWSATIFSGNWIMLYLLFSFGNGSMPGSSDWKSACKYLLSILGFLTLCSVVIITIMPSVITDYVYIDLWLSILAMLVAELGLVVLIDLIIFLLLLVPSSFARPFCLDKLAKNSLN